MKWRIPCQAVETVVYEVEAPSWTAAIEMVQTRWDLESEEGVIERTMDFGGPFDAFAVKS